MELLPNVGRLIISNAHMMYVPLHFQENNESDSKKRISTHNICSEHVLRECVCVIHF